MPAEIYVSETGAHAHAVGIVHGNRAHAAGLGVVHIGIEWKTLVNQSVVESLVKGQPLVLLEAPHGHRTFGAVKIVPDVRIRFLLPEVRQNLQILPLVIAHGGPIFKVLGQPAQENLAIDGAGPAHHLASGHREVVPVGSTRAYE